MCVVKDTIQLERAMIPKGLSPYSIQGVLVEGGFIRFILTHRMPIRAHPGCAVHGSPQRRHNAPIHKHSDGASGANVVHQSIRVRALPDVELPRSHRYSGAVSAVQRHVKPHPDAAYGFADKRRTGH